MLKYCQLLKLIVIISSFLVTFSNPLVIVVVQKSLSAA